MNYLLHLLENSNLEKEKSVYVNYENIGVINELVKIDG